MMKILCQISPSLITIFLALVAAFIALYQAKSNIISKARVNWIENLRESISSYCVEISNVGSLLSVTEFEAPSYKDKSREETLKHGIERYSLYLEASNRADRLGNKVILFLNSEEPDHKRIEYLITELQNNIEKTDGEIRKNKVDESTKEIISLSKIIFKREWKKSKKIFRI